MFPFWRSGLQFSIFGNLEMPTETNPSVFLVQLYSVRLPELGEAVKLSFVTREGKMKQGFHGVFDYVWAIALIASPWVLGFARNGMETWLPVVLGALVLFYSLFTAYEAGLLRVLPMPAHQIVDSAIGVVLLFSPWALGFSDLIWLPHFLFGILILAAGLFTERVVATGAG